MSPRLFELLSYPYDLNLNGSLSSQNVAVSASIFGRKITAQTLIQNLIEYINPFIQPLFITQSTIQSIIRPFLSAYEWRFDLIL